MIKIYGIENPGYPKIAKIYDSMHVSYSAIDLDEHGVCIYSLEDHQIDIMHLSPSHHFPTGIITPISVVMNCLVGLLRMRTVILSKMIMTASSDIMENPIPAMQGLDDGENVIYMGTFSKAIAPAIRASYMVLPKKLAKRYQQIGQTFSCAVSRIDQKVLTLFLTEGHFERHLNRMRNIYKEKHDLLIKEIKKLNSDIQIYGHGAGAHIIVRFPVSDQKEFQKKLRQKGVMIYPLSWYYIEGKPLKEEYILGFTRMKKEDMIRGIEIIGEVLYSK